jgi:hypothetical protein
MCNPDRRAGRPAPTRRIRPAHRAGPKGGTADVPNRRPRTSGRPVRPSRTGGASPRPVGTEVERVVDGVDEIVTEFSAESAEHLERLGLALVELEHDPAAADRLDGIFRIVQMLEGTSAFLGFDRRERLARRP